MIDFVAQAPARFLRGSARSRARSFASVALVYLAAYFALNILTAHRSLNGTAVTLWSPDNALSVMLIMESWAFAPIVWLAQIATGLWISVPGHSTAAIVAAETTLALGYAAIATIHRRGFGFDIRAMQPRDLIAVMAVVPLGAALTGVVYCGALWLVGEVPPGALLPMYTGFWVGDAAAMGVIIPAAGALLRVAASAPWRRPNFGYSLTMLAVTLTFLMLIIAISASGLDRRYLFNLLYLPIILIGLKFGYDAGALVLLFVQLFLLAALEVYRVPDSEFGAYQVMMFVLAVAGQALGAAVTEWEAATSRLRGQQAELAKVSSRATNGMLAAAMAHEISQPLASIAGYMHAARRILENDSAPDKALAALRKAEGEAARARAIIERLRDFVAAGAVAREPVDLERLLATIMRLEADVARIRGVALRRFDPETRSWLANVDRVAVEQALNNLVVNAIEAAPAVGGQVTLSLSRRGGNAVFAIEDNGPGVAPEIAEFLFEPFETTKPRGMGLGLPLAREIALRHGGALSWRPLSPHGTRFELELPFA